MQGSGTGSSGRPGEANSDGAHAALVHPGPEEGAGRGSSLDPSAHGPTGDQHTGLQLIIYKRQYQTYVTL